MSSRSKRNIYLIALMGLVFLGLFSYHAGLKELLFIEDSVVLAGDEEGEAKKPVIKEVSAKKDEMSPEKASPQEIKEGETPEIEFEELTYDFGDSKQNESLTHEFKFKNKGDAELKIEDVRAG